MTGREELGFNKIYADAMRRELSQDGKRDTYRAGWGGTDFMELTVDIDGRNPHLGSWRQGPTLHYRVIARTGEWERSAKTSARTR